MARSVYPAYPLPAINKSITLSAQSREPYSLLSDFNNRIVDLVSLIPQTLPTLELDFGVSAGLLMPGQARDLHCEAS